MKIPETMRAARFYEVNKPLVIETVPVPEIKEDDALIQVKAAGLCGSDIHLVFEGAPTAFKPIILGHEAAGILAKIGRNVQDWKIGTHVSVYPIIYCGKCVNCASGNMEICLSRSVVGVSRDGALAEYLAVPAKNLVRLPENMPLTVGAIICDAVPTPFHALIDRLNLKPGESIAIYGTGGLGLHAVQIAKMAGAGRIFAIDPLAEQLNRAKKMGADIIINPKLETPSEAIRNATDGLGVDMAADFVGIDETLNQAMMSVKPGGRVAVVGLGFGPNPVVAVPIRHFVLREISLLASYGFNKRTIERLVDLVASGRLELLDSITHNFKLHQVNTALKYLHEKIENPIRVVVTI